jgi:hypothetical protein
MPRFPRGGISGGGAAVSQRENLAIMGDNKIASGPLDEGPARYGMILAAAGIGPNGEINI